jgi:hypothetical protein
VTPVALPPNAAPAISLAHAEGEYFDVESRLAQFIRALQRGDRAQAAQWLSHRVPAAERAAAAQGAWLRRDPRSREDVNQILFVSDLQIQPRQQIEGNAVDLFVVPRKIPFNYRKKHKDTRLVGYLQVPMRKEDGEWRVYLRRRRIVH